MDGLDFSALSDDQLVELARACCIEAIRRNPATQEAMQDMMIGEAERARIARQAQEAEIAAVRARERERIAQEAARRVRDVHEARHAQARAAAALQAAEAARRRDALLLEEAGRLVFRHPSKISLLHARTPNGVRIFINPGAYRYTRQHLAALDLATGTITCVAALARNKTDVLEFLTRASTLLPVDALAVGEDHQWPDT